MGFMTSLTTYFSIATFANWCRLHVRHKAPVTWPILR